MQAVAQEGTPLAQEGTPLCRDDWQRDRLAATQVGNRLSSRLYPAGNPDNIGKVMFAKSRADLYSARLNSASLRSDSREAELLV